MRMSLYQLLAEHGDLIREPERLEALSKSAMLMKPEHPEEVHEERPALAIGLVFVGLALFFHHMRRDEPAPSVPALEAGRP